MAVQQQREPRSLYLSVSGGVLSCDRANLLDLFPAEPRLPFGRTTATPVALKRRRMT
jgi:hypothetical protein